MVTYCLESDSIKQVQLYVTSESPSLAYPRRIAAVGVCPPRSPRRLGTPVGRVTVRFSSRIRGMCTERGRSRFPLVSRVSSASIPIRRGARRVYTWDGRTHPPPGGLSVESRTRTPSPHPTRRPERLAVRLGLGNCLFVPNLLRIFGASLCHPYKGSLRCDCGEGGFVYNFRGQRYSEITIIPKIFIGF